MHKAAHNPLSVVVIINGVVSHNGKKNYARNYWIRIERNNTAKDVTYHRHERWPQRSKVEIITSRCQFDAFAHSSTKKCRRITNIGRKAVRAMGDIAHQFQGQRSMVIVTPLNAVTENQPYRRNGKACKSPLARGGGILWRPRSLFL